jgi:predicted ATP-dependent serine protease
MQTGQCPDCKEWQHLSPAFAIRLKEQDAERRDMTWHTQQFANH